MKKLSKIKAVLFILALVSAIGTIFLCLPQKRNPNEYRNILTRLKNEGYTCRFPDENFTGKTALLIHDVDYSFSGAAVLAKVEREFGVRSVFCLRPSAGWYTQSISSFQRLEQEGFKVAIQQDCLSRSDGNATLALQLFKAQLKYMCEFFNVTVSDYHGDVEYNVEIGNFELYDAETWRQLGLTEIYAYQNYSYIRDTDNKLIIPETLKDLVIVQLHSDWW